MLRMQARRLPQMEHPSRLQLPGLGSATSDGQQHVQRLPRTPTLWGRQLVLAKRLGA
jgi:hypothetical protein